MTGLKVLISREQIAKRVAELGAEITRDFAGQPVILVGVLKGSAIFLADLAREVKLEATFEARFDRRRLAQPYRRQHRTDQEPVRGHAGRCRGGDEHRLPPRHRLHAGPHAAIRGEPR